MQVGDAGVQVEGRRGADTVAQVETDAQKQTLAYHTRTHTHTHTRRCSGRIAARSAVCGLLLQTDSWSVFLCWSRP